MSEAEWARIFGDNLRDIMIETRDKQSQLAESIGTNQSTISRFIKGFTIPSIFNIINLGYELAITTDELMDFGDSIE